MSKESIDIVGKLWHLKRRTRQRRSILLFQFLLDSGMIHSLQGSYQEWQRIIIDWRDTHANTNTEKRWYRMRS